MKNLNLWIAWKYNQKNWKQLALGGFGIAISFVLISAAFFVSDSIRYTYEQQIIEPLDNLDLQLSSKGTKLINQSIEDAIREDESLVNELDGISPRLLFEGSTINNPEKELIGVGIALIGIDFKKDEAIGSFRKSGKEVSIRLENATVENNKTTLNAVITDLTAFNLQLAEKNFFNLQFQPFHYVPPIELHLKVQEIVDSKGKAALYTDNSIFVKLDELQEVLEIEKSVNIIALSWKGVPEQSWRERQDVVVPMLNDFLTDDWSEIEVIHSREEVRSAIDNSANSMLQFISVMSLPSLIAGTFLIILIFYLVVDERRKELAKLKAVGFHWWDMFTQLIIENLTLGFFGCMFGMIGGIGLTELILQQFRNKLPEGMVMNIGGAQYGMPYVLYITPSSLLAAVLIGLLAVLLPTLIVAWRISRINVVEALSAQEMTISPKKNRKMGILTTILSVILIIFGINQVSESIMLFLIFWGAGVLLMYLAMAYITQKRNFLLFLWTIVNFSALILLFTNNFFNSVESDLVMFDFIIGFVYGILLTCILFVQLLPYLITIITWLFSSVKQSSLAVMYALANLRQHRTRTLFVSIIFSLILSIMFIFSLLSTNTAILLESELNQITMGADYIVSTSLPITNSTQLEERLSEYGLDNQIELLDSWSIAIAEVNFTEMSYRANESLYDRELYSICGIDTKTKENLGVRIYDPVRSAKYSEEETWEHVFAGNGILLPSSYRTELEMPLTNTIIKGEEENKTIEILGFAEVSSQLFDVLMGESLFSELFPSFKGSRLHFFEFHDKNLKEQEDAITETQSDITKALYPWIPIVLSSYVIHQQADLNFAQFIGTLENFLLLGVIIGIIGIILVNTRRIQSSQFEYGVLISFGASKRDLIATTTIETLLLVGISILIGYLIPLLFIIPLFNMMVGSQIVFPIYKIILWALATLATALVGSQIPFYQILRLQPNEILRHVE
ncbi:MAG: ABC transporter permease [Promethearchaeota archaeon]